MFNLTGTEIVVILLLALVVLGPEKLPDAIRRFGRTYSELKKMSTGFQQEFRSALDEPMREMRDSADLLRRSADFSVDRPPDLRPAETGRADTSPAEPTTELPFADRPAGSNEVVTGRDEVGEPAADEADPGRSGADGSGPA